MSKYVVTRQHQWATGDYVVEISQGGIDYTNPDALAGGYPGEFEEINDPREAVNTAIEIAQAWKKDEPKLKIGIAMGFTHGMTMPFEGEPANKRTFQRLRKAAQELFDNAPKCCRCGDILPDKKHRWRLTDYDDMEFCDQQCAERFYEDDQAQLQAELAGEGEDDDEWESDDE